MVTGFFPPYSPLGAVRAPALVAHWQERGHDLRVLAMENPAIRGMLDAPLPPEKIIYAPLGMASRQPEAHGAAGQNGRTSAADSPAEPSGLIGILRRFYWYAAQFPDRYRGWIDQAVAAGRTMANAWRPELIYSSAPPHSGHVVACRLSRQLGIPWIAELRDTWARNPYTDAPWLMRLIRDRYANAVLRHARACVTLTRTAQAEVEATVHRPTIVSYNGFSPEDFSGLESVPAWDTERLDIIHAGIIYAGRRDPTALFQALALMGAERRYVRVRFFHDELDAVTRSAEQLGVHDSVEICRPVPRREILRIQRGADVLLLCRWANPADDGIIPGKLFEYIGARRPILAVGSTTGEASEIVRTGPFGRVSNTPVEIADQLRAWIREKRAAGGRLPDLPSAPTEAYLRDTQFARIDELLLQRVAA